MKLPLSALLLLTTWSAIPAVPPPRPASSPFSSSATAAGDSTLPLLSDDGAVLAFLSSAPNLTVDGQPSRWLDLVVRNREGRLLRMGQPAFGASMADVTHPALSIDGGVVAFVSAGANFSAGDTNEASDVFVRAVAGGPLELISVNRDGSAPGNGASAAPALSNDGRFVAFESVASDLVTNDVNGLTDVFVRDRLTGVTELISVDDAGFARGGDSPMISQDGRFVAYAVRDAVGFGERPTRRVFVRDRLTGVTREAGAGLTDRVPAWALSADGTGLVLAAGGAVSVELYRFDVATGARLSITTLATEVDPVAISADGVRVAYMTGTNLIVWSSSGALTNVAGMSGAPAALAYRGLAFSRDTERLAFLAAMPGSVPVGAAAPELIWRLYQADLLSGTVVLVATTTNGLPAAVDPSTVPSLSMDGRWVAFDSAAADLTGGDLNQANDVFLRDLEIEGAELVSRARADRPGRTAPAMASQPPSLSADGRLIAFRSFDSQLTPPGPPGSFLLDGVAVPVSGVDTNGHPDLFVRDLWTGVTQIAPGGYGTNILAFPQISGDGSSLVLRRELLNPASSSDDFQYDVWYAALSDGTVSWLSSHHDFQNLPRYLSSTFRFGLSFNGRLVSFESPNRPIGGITFPEWAYVRDVVTGSYFGFSSGAGGAAAPTIVSPDGRWFVYPTRAATPGGDASGSRPVALDRADLGSDPASPNLTNPPVRRISLDASGQPLAGDIASFVVSANSRFVAFTYPATWTVYRHDLLGNDPANLIVCTELPDSALSPDGRWVAYEVRSVDLRHNDLRLKDLVAGTDTLITAGLRGTGGDGNSFGASVGPGGRVLFASAAANLVANDANRATDIFLYDPALGGVMLLTARADGHSGNGPSMHPALSADGSTAAFLSFASDLIPGDFNERSDVFVVQLGSGDSDGDGLDDGWEMTYFGTLERDGAGDFDGDGATDAAEFAAGTDPTNQNSVLRVLAIQAVQGGSRTLIWSAQSAVKYQLEYQDELGSVGWLPVPGEPLLGGLTASQVDSDPAPHGRRFYRVKVVR